MAAYGRKIEALLKERFDALDQTAEYNQWKVINAMQKNRVKRRVPFRHHRIRIR